jgi:hypothetical protein
MMLQSRKPPERYDDPATEQQLTLELLTAQTPRDYQDFSQHLAQSMDRLKPETVRSLLSQSVARREANHYSQTAEYKDGMRLLMLGDFPEAGLIGQQMLNEDEKFRRRHAMEVYDSRMSGLSQTDPQGMRAQARDIALEVRRTYLDILPTSPSQIPRILLDDKGKLVSEQARVITTLKKEVDAGRLSKDSATQFFQYWQHLATKAASTSAPSPPAKPTSPLNPTTLKPQGAP